MREVDKGVLDFWDALDRVDPLPDSWTQTQLVCSQIEKLIATTMASSGVEHSMSPPETFMPPMWVPPPTPKPVQQSDEEQCAALDKKLG